MLIEYFQAKIGQAIYRKVIGGNKNCFGPPYAKQYKAEVLCVEGNHVTVNVTVTAICPSGVTDGGFRGKTYLGDHMISTSFDGLEDFWAVLVGTSDPKYVIRYFMGLNDES